MADIFLAEIRIFPFNFPPKGWAFCTGQLLSISQNTALFSLIGTYYGGNGQSNFGLPNLQGQVALGVGNGAGLSQYVQGETGGTDTVTLLQTEMPLHNHAAICDTTGGNDYGPTGDFWAPDVANGSNEYGSGAAANMAITALAVVGGSQPHNNLQPYLVMNYCIAMQGIYPSRG
jgi:microcystin-dependent protein